MSSPQQNESYSCQKQKFLFFFDRLIKPLPTVLSSRYENVTIQKISSQARQEFADILPTIPFIGFKNIFLNNLMGGAVLLAIYKTLKKYGQPVEEIGKICYELAEATFRGYPKIFRFILQIMAFSKFSKNIFRKNAALSLKRRYPQEFIFTFVEGNGRDFDFGIDINSCTICTLFQHHNADEFTPYACLWDFPGNKVIGTGLTRTMTIAEGYLKCDFRFKKGRAVTQGWPPEFRKKE